MASEGDPYVLLQVRAFLSGRLAVVPHPAGITNDYDWGRGGMHQAWGLGVPLLALPFHLLGRLFGAPGFPDDVRFLVLYAVTAVLLARALHMTAGAARAAQGELPALATSTGIAGLVMVFPTFVGMIAVRFLVYEQTIATGVLWDLGLLAGLLLVVARCTPARLAALCAAAGFAILIRPTLAVYGASTVALALLVAARKGLGRRSLLTGVASFAGVSCLYLAGNALRFGSPFDPGYGNCISGPFVNRLARWGLPFAHVPMRKAAKEMFAMLFLLPPIPADVTDIPASVLKYLNAERWREYYTPTFDLLVFVVAVVCTLLVVSRVLRARLWRSARTLEADTPTLIGLWGIVPVVVLFVFYARIGNSVTRYAVDMVPGFVAMAICVGMTVVGAARSLSPVSGIAVQVAVTVLAVWYTATQGRGWTEHLSYPVDRTTIVDRVAAIDKASVYADGIPTHFQAAGIRGPQLFESEFREWDADGSFPSGMVFAMPRSRCVALSFYPPAGQFEWTDADLSGVRATADSDALVRCGPPLAQGLARVVTLCEPHAPAYLLDGLRLYSVAALDEDLEPEPLRLTRIDAVPRCP